MKKCYNQKSPKWTIFKLVFKFYTSCIIFSSYNSDQLSVTREIMKIDTELSLPTIDNNAESDPTPKFNYTFIKENCSIGKL